MNLVLKKMRPEKSCVAFQDTNEQYEWCPENNVPNCVHSISGHQ